MAAPARTVKVPVVPKVDLDPEQIEAFAIAARAAADAMREMQAAYVRLGAVLVEVLKPALQQEDHALTR